MFPQCKIISNLNLQYDNMKQELWKFYFKAEFLYAKIDMF